MIPKIIHFCWLSGEPYPDVIAKCISSWKKQMSDFEFKCWTQENFDINSNEFVKEAVILRKWAFASDYIRLYALYNYGGIYLDSDVFVFKSLEPLLINKAFSAIEYCVSSNSFTCNIEAAIIGAEKGNLWIKQCLKQYDNRKFILPNGNLNQIIIPEIVANVSEKFYGFKRVPKNQVLKDGVVIYESKYLAHAYLECKSIKDTYAIHLCEGSWYKKNKSLKRCFSLFRRFIKHPLKTIYMLYWKNEINKMINNV